MKRSVEASIPRGRRESAPSTVVTMTSTEAQNGFGRMLETVARHGTVLITRHNTTQAVVLSPEEYAALTRGEDPDLDALTAEFDSLLDAMQDAGAQRALLDGFRATPDELSRAAVAAARRNAV